MAIVLGNLLGPGSEGLTKAAGRTTGKRTYVKPLDNFFVLKTARGLAEGVVVESTGPVDDGTTVQFYSSNDCSPGTEISSADDGCISIDNALVGAYQSFRVIRTRIPTRREDLPKTSFHERRRDSSADLPAPSPPDVAEEPAAFHGMTASFDGVEYRWHQLAPGTFIGVLPDKWDDSIHVMNNMDWLGQASNTSVTPREVLDDRDLFQGLCQTTAQCIGRARAGAVTILDVAGPYFDRAQTVAKQSGRNLWAFLTSGPLYQQIVVSKF
jgi:hypothetical protein